jgi:hypothetical protein
LALFGGDEQSAPTPVIGQSDRAKNTSHRKPSGARVGQSHQREHCGSFGGHEPVCVSVKRATLPCARERRERAESDVNEQIVRAVDGACEREVHLSTLELSTRHLERIEGRCARCVEAQRGTLEPKGARCEQRRQP